MKHIVYIYESLMWVISVILIDHIREASVALAFIEVATSEEIMRRTLIKLTRDGGIILHAQILIVYPIPFT